MSDSLKILGKNTSDPLRALFSVSSLDTQDWELSFNVESLKPTYNIDQTQIEGSGINVTRVQTVELSFPQNISSELADQIIEQIADTEFVTHKTSLSIPTPDTDSNYFNYNPYTSDAFSYYNFRNEAYEDYTLAVDENELPNFLLGALWSHSEEQQNLDYREEQREYYTMFAAANTPLESLENSSILAKAADINNYEFDSEFIVYNEIDFDPKLEEKKDYYKQLIAQTPTPTVPEYYNSNRNIFVDFNYTAGDSAQIGNTPFFNKIKLPSVSFHNPFGASTRVINEAFSESGFTDKLLKSFRHGEFVENLTAVRSNGNQIPLKTYSLDALFRSIQWPGVLLAEYDEMYLRSHENSYTYDTTSLPFVYYYNRMILLGKLREAAFNLSSNFTSLIENNNNHNGFLLGYKVVKRREGTTAPIQTYYFLRTKTELEDFIDSQIKFDVVYTYDVHAITVVFGSSYTYENIRKFIAPDYVGIKFDFRITSDVQLVEMPISSHVLRVVEPPPINPEIFFYNEKTQKNKVKIRLEHQDGNIVDEYSRKPMMPFGDNFEYIQKLEQYFKSDNIMATTGKTSAGVYEVYRIDYPPTSYLDFEEALIATVQSNVTYENGSQSKNVMFNDYIKHQKKYYYCFRTLTHRGNPSELSKVFVVEMYEDADETFLTFDIYEPPAPEYFQKKSHMRKYLQIIPNEEQTRPNSEFLIDNFESAQEAISNDALVLGNSDQEYLWEYNSEKKYLKLRLESKNSGRKMDINLYFEIKPMN